MENMPKQGILLANLGTPDEPTVPAVKRFLAQFLMDKRVVDLTRWLWCPLLHGIILPTRSPRVAKLYKTVWMDDGSPLIVYSKLQAQALKELLDVPVELGMTYGNPSLQSGIERLMEQGCKEIIVLPLFPQYSSTTTAAVSDGLTDAFKKMPEIPGYTVIRDYHDHPMYIKALADSVRAHWEKYGQSEYLLCSYHGIPKRYADNGDIYPQHCEATTRLLAQELELDDKQIGMAYQSRFGREEWLQPYTDETMEALPSRGTKKLQVITPAFSVDCLETLEEIAEENKEIFMEAGGEDYQYIPCLNADPSHIEMMKVVIKQYLR
jgi:ferrochelatase